jgi:hypothetical protein
MNHHRLIRHLVAELRAVRQELDGAETSAHHAQQTAQRNANYAREARDRLDREREQVESDRYERERITREMDKAHEYGDEMKEKRLRERLKWY